MSTLNNRLVAVLNKNIETGKAMNALAHMSVALGGILDAEKLALIDYYDKDGHCYPQISKIPFIVCRATGGKLKTLDTLAQEQDIQRICFTNTMTVGTWEEQIATAKKTARENTEIYGIVLYGPGDAVTALTKKFSLWR